MKNLLLPILIIALTVGFGCKNLIQEKSLVGKWRPLRVNHSEKWEDISGSNDFIEFLENKDFGMKLFGEYSHVAKYSVNNSLTPNRIEIKLKDGKQIMTLIYKFEGEKLIIKEPQPKNDGVAKHFEPELTFKVKEYVRKTD